MPQGIEGIVKAIESLQQEASLFKDYVFPIASAFFTSLLGAGVAYLTFNHQDKIKIEKERMSIVNHWTLIVDEAITTLITIKQNYHEKITDNPFERAMFIPFMLFSSKKIEEEYSHLSFLVKNKKDDNNEKWSQISRIRAMISNYNYIQDIWNERNKVIVSFRESLFKDNNSKPFTELSAEVIISKAGADSFGALIDLTEHAIILTDDILIELDDFLNNFSTYAKSVIDIKTIKKYGTILSISTKENKFRQELIEKSKGANYKIIAPFFGVTEEEIKTRYSTGY
jgi:hypothetical protein